jgi:hypothetical protein
MSLTLYFFLYPIGHFGLIAVTFLVVLPFAHVIEVFFKLIGFGEGEAGAAIGRLDSFDFED